MAGNPGDLRTIDFLGMKLVVAGLVRRRLLRASACSPAMPRSVSSARWRWAASGSCCPRSGSAGASSGARRRSCWPCPDTLDLLTISVSAGLSFDGALAKVVEKLHGPLSDEFRRALAEIRVGKTRREALRDIVGRTEVPALSNFIGAIVQAEQLGVPIAKVLQVQSEQLRIERRQRAEEMAAKAPIKMLFPLVGCIFPSMFIVILGPAVILIAHNMSTGTNDVHVLFMTIRDRLRLPRGPGGGRLTEGGRCPRAARAVARIVWWVRGAHGAVELPAGSTAAAGLRTGDYVRLEPAG